MATLRLEIVTPVRRVYSQDVNMVVATAVDGELGVMAHHIPLVTVLVPGVMRIHEENGTELRMAVGGGFMEVSPENKVTVLAQTAELSHEIDVDRARSAYRRAKERLQDQDNPDIDVQRAEAALRRAIVRLQAVGERPDE
ncbi:MAG: F0F1 ATP synthase subunit epsilon [Bacillota bacterium]|jgi:F-type H+-transporting ATPase subunit epsilon